MATIKLELLAPAKNVQTGIAAINHGADAVYIGGPSFGARAAAANSLADIELLVRHAHLFHARVYVALNTIFGDRELENAVRLSHELYDRGVDALIIQDVGLLEKDLPPIPLHSSTQMNNRSPEKVRFLEEVGFKQVVLARELSLEEIRNIRRVTNVALEHFVHGALCVSYSGQCYISEIMAGRSANRGECAQFCRHSYDLKDMSGSVLEKDRYLLSLKDLDLSAHLRQLIDAGISSFKIEGRLKDANYVKNVTAHYRTLLDEIIAADSSLSKSSSGSFAYSFSPDPEKSFHRGDTDYFLHGGGEKVAELRSPKSTGKSVGRVARIEQNYFTIEGKEKISNGDGLCFYDKKSTLQGLRVNREDQGRIYPKDGTRSLGLTLGTEVYRNLDVEFYKELGRSEQCRSIAASLRLLECEDGLDLFIKDEDGIASTVSLQLTKEKAKRPGDLLTMLGKQLKKSGGTIFSVKDVDVKVAPDLFFKASDINSLRRRGFEEHEKVRLGAYVPEQAEFVKNEYPWLEENVSYLDNISNSSAVNFYRRHGVNLSAKEAGVLSPITADNPALMRTKYCVRHQLQRCPKQPGQKGRAADTLIISDNTGEYLLEFDCRKCEMIVRRHGENTPD
jgi:collagenase-like PrtC family protease